MECAANIDAWLARNKADLLEHGASMLELDPAYERLVPYDELIHGVAVEVKGQKNVILAGARPRHNAHNTKGPFGALNVDPTAIIYDEPGETFDLAIDTIARHRVMRHSGNPDSDPQFVRVAAVILKFMQYQGVKPKDRYEMLRSTFEGFSFGAVAWEPNSGPDILQRKVTRDRPGFLFSNQGGTLGAYSLWLGGDNHAFLDLRTLCGANGRRYGRLTLNAEIPLTIANAAVEKPLASLVAYPLTDSFKLWTIDVRVSDGFTEIYFGGAEKMRENMTLFEDPALNKLFAAEVAKLRRIRRILFGMLSVSTLSDGWWQQFKKLATGRGAPQIAHGMPLRRTAVWAI